MSDLSLDPKLSSSNVPEAEVKPPPLPELHGGMLSHEMLGQLFDDYRHCVTVTEIIPKYAAQTHVPEQTHLSLDQAQSLLQGKEVRAIQVRYRYDEVEWWDTVMVLPDGFRLVRIQHHFGQR